MAAPASPEPSQPADAGRGPSWLAAGAVVVLVALVAWRVGLAQRRPEPPTSGPAAVEAVVVDVAALRLEPIAPTTELLGLLRAAERVDILAQVPAVVDSVVATEGQVVQAGGALLRLSSPDILAGAERARAGLLAARAKLDQATLGAALSEPLADARIDQAAAGERAAREAVRQAAGGGDLRTAAARGDIERAREGLAAAEADAERARQAVRLTDAQTERDEADAAAAVDAARADRERAEAGAGLTAEAARADLAAAEAGQRAAGAQLDRLRAGASADELAALAAQHRQAELARDHARRELDDLRRLHAAGGLAGADLRGAELRLEVADEQVKAAAAQLQRARSGAGRAELAAAEAQVDQAAAGVDAAQAALARGTVSEKEVAAARAQESRAEAGLRLARATSADRQAEARSRLAAAEAQVRLARAALRTAEQADPSNLLAADIAAAAAQRERAAAGLREARLGRGEAGARRLDVTAAEAGVLDAQAQLRLATSLAGRLNVIAPVAGRVADLLVSPGDTVLPGSPLAVLDHADGLELVALCGLAQMEHLQRAAGQAATVYPAADGTPRPGVPAQVSRLGEVAESDGRSFEVGLQITVADPPAWLRPGVRLRAEVEVDAATPALVTAADAIQHDAAGGEFVHLAVRDRAVRVPVTVVRRAGPRVAIASADPRLRAGVEIIVRGDSPVFDTAAIVRRDAGG